MICSYNLFERNTTNKRKFQNVRNILQLAETEAILWNEAQVTMPQMDTQLSSNTDDTRKISPKLGRWCFTDKSWKDKCWFSTLERFESLMRTRNTRANQSLLHAEFEALIWAMECMKFFDYFK